MALLIPRPDFDRTHRYPPSSPNSRHDLADIAGEYQKGIGIGAGWNLSILSDGRYSFFLSGCTGVGSRESGYVRRLGANFVLAPSALAESMLEHAFFPIRWGGRS
jgi:hypothetical protein